MDVTRATRLQAAGYRVVAQLIPAEITPKNRLLLAERGTREHCVPLSVPGIEAVDKQVIQVISTREAIGDRR